jgi:thiamine pyrophosphate-dependent acetolactate synthase large subunit-like protein
VKIFDFPLARIHSRPYSLRMSNATATSQIAKDLATIDLVMAIGTKQSKRKATKHRKVCFSEIKRLNREDGLDSIDLDELADALR